MAQVTELERLKTSLGVIEEIRSMLIVSGQADLVPDWEGKEQVIAGMRARIHELEMEQMAANLRVLDELLERLESSSLWLKVGRSRL